MSTTPWGDATVTAVRGEYGIRTCLKTSPPVTSAIVSSPKSSHTRSGSTFGFPLSLDLVEGMLLERGMQGSNRREVRNVSSRPSQPPEISSFHPVRNAPHSKFTCIAFRRSRSGTLWPELWPEINPQGRTPSVYPSSSSCDISYYTAGIATGTDSSAGARRHHDLDRSRRSDHDVAFGARSGCQAACRRQGSV